MRIPANIFLLAGLATLPACHREAPLSPDLASIACPLNRKEHARATFGKAQLTFLCISKEMADTPYLLRCDLESHPMICEDAGSFLFVRSTDGVTYAGPGPKSLSQPGGAESGPALRSRLVVNFHAGPPRTSTFEEAETDWRFLTPAGKDLLPAGFTFVKGTLCDRRSTVLGTGSCNLEARTPSLYWHIAVYLPAESGTPIGEDEYREELAYWLSVLGQLVQDPKKS